MARHCQWSEALSWESSLHCSYPRCCSCLFVDTRRQFFLNGKTLPVERGAGVGQRIMGVAARALAHGEWLHIFPEGRVTPDGRVGPFRQGIGRLVCDAKAAAGGRCGG
jgi:monolysocardiolipin acyltransferase